MQEKEKYYFTRTLEHIHRVHNNMLYLITECHKELDLTTDHRRMLMAQVLPHDISKFNSKQFQPYIDFSWSKKTGTKLDVKTQTKFDIAWKDHYTIENHHPEKDDNDTVYVPHIIEIACDLQAMSQEFGEGTYKKYLEETWLNENKQYFLEDDFIYVTNQLYFILSLFEKQLSSNV